MAALLLQQQQMVTMMSAVMSVDQAEADFCSRILMGKLRKQILLSLRVRIMLRLD